MTKAPQQLVCRALVVVALVFSLGACSSSGSSKARPADDPKTREITVTLTKSGCNPANFTLKPGPVVFVVTSPKSSASGVATEMEVQNAEGHELSDVEGVQPGRTRSFAVNLEAGKKYLVRCPEEQRPGGTITVSAGAAR
jgi:uncharacterized cupredoxin-like copper-binding protein